jgi:hypothetical protein
MKKIFFSKDVALNLIQGLIVLILALFLFSSSAFAFVSGSTGADGALNPTANTEVVLPADGILNYTTINIPSGKTVTFKRNTANTPVYILATGDVTIAGTINVSGATSSNTAPGIGGPGGYDGGYGGSTGMPGGKGLGPGGGEGGPSATYRYGGGGGYATAGGTQGANYGAGGSTYGNVRIVPLVGGSGGGGCAGLATASCYGGGGGGGAILIASSGTITVTGYIMADGGNSTSSYNGAGSGGAIRLMATTITGNGTISAKGGSLSYLNKGGEGRIRLEADTNNFSAGTDPVYTSSPPGSVFMTNVPTLSIASVAGFNTPSNPGGSYSQPDILLPSATTNPVTVHITATNIPVVTTVTVSVTPQYGSATSVNTTLSGTDASSTADANVNLSTQYSNVITAKATFQIVIAMYYDGEKIEKVRVATTMGGNSEAVYITEKGREIKSTELLAKLIGW